MASLANERVGIFSKLYLSVHELTPAGSFNSTLRDILDLLGEKGVLSDTSTGSAVEGATQNAIQIYVAGLLALYRLHSDWVPFSLVGSPSMTLLTYLSNYRLVSNMSFPQIAVAGNTSTNTLSFQYNNSTADLATLISSLNQGTKRLSLIHI